MQSAVFVRMCVFMRVHMLGFLFALHRYNETRAMHAAFDAVFARKCHAGQTHRIELCQYGLRPVGKFQQCRRQHVACCAHSAVEIQCFHFFASI